MRLNGHIKSVSHILVMMAPVLLFQIIVNFSNLTSQWTENRRFVLLPTKRSLFTLHGSIMLKNRSSTCSVLFNKPRAEVLHENALNGTIIWGIYRDIFCKLTPF